MSRSSVVGLLKYLVAVALLGFVVASNWTRLKVQFSQPPDAALFALAGLTFAGITGLQYVRWFLLVRAVGLPFTLWNAVRLGLVGTFYNAFLPSSIGGDLVKAYVIAGDHPERKPTAVATVVFDRLVGLFGLLLLAGTAGGGFWLAGDPQLVGRPALQQMVLLCGGLAAAGAGGFVALGLIPAALADRLGAALGRVPKLGRTLAEVWDTVRLYRRRPGTAAAVVGLSAVAHVGMVVLFFLCVRVFPPPHPALLAGPAEHCVVGPIGFIAQAGIPLPGGVGGGEAVFGWLYELVRGDAAEAAGLDRRAAFAAGVGGRFTLRVIEWGLGLAGYVAFLRMRRELPAAAAGDGPGATPEG